jgi:hypothetical protein
MVYAVLGLYVLSGVGVGVGDLNYLFQLCPTD